MTAQDILDLKMVEFVSKQYPSPNPCSHILQAGKYKGEPCYLWGAVQIGERRYCETHAIKPLVALVQKLREPDAYVLRPTAAFPTLDAAVADDRRKIVVNGGTYTDRL